ncbi:MAG: O-antigen ligase family protein [Planctomycetaceae bacterium]
MAALCAAAVVGPLCLGGAPTWPRFAIEAAMAAAVVAWAVTAPRPRWLVLVPLGIAALACLQVVPLPGGLLMRIAPVSAGKWAVANEAARNSWATVSVDPSATMTAIRRLLLAVATAAAVADLGRMAACRRWLAGAVAVAGLAILATGWMFPVRDRVVLGFIDLKGPIEYWLTPLEPPLQTAGFGYAKWITVGGYRYLTFDGASADGFGCYLNSNHFAGALCLAWPVVLGAWLWLTQGRLPAVARHAAVVGATAIAVWTAGGMAHSRAGSASLLFGALVFLSLVAVHPWLRRASVAVTGAALVGIVGFVVVFLGGFTGIVGWFSAGWQPRVASLMHDPRTAAAAAALRMFKASPVLGTGLDTYAELAKPIGPSSDRLFYAHNDYAQALAEGGLVGALLVTAVVALLAIRLRAFVRAAPSPMRPLDAGCWAALAGLAVHTCFDWNLHVPANALLACVIAGLALGSSAGGDAAATAQPPGRGTGGRVAAIGLSLACVVAAAVLGRDAWSERTQRQLRVAVTSARHALQDGSRTVDAAALPAALEAGERMAGYDPGNPRLAVLLGQANLHLAVLASTGAASEASVEAAQRWFARARRDAATCVDVCEPVPPKPARAD